MIQQHPHASAAHVIMTKPQMLRAEGRTKRAVVWRRTVTFQRLSERCLKTVVWDSFWTVHYPTKAAAEAAAELWMTEGKIITASGKIVK